MVRSPLVLALGALGSLALVAGCKPAAAVETPIAEGPQPLVETTPATAAQLCDEPPRAWSILDGGLPVGETLGGCVGREDDGRYHLLTQLVAEDTVTYEMHLWLDGGGAPRDAQLRTPTAVTDFHWSEAGLTETRFGDDRTLPAKADQTVWVVPSHALYLREVMLRLGVGLGDGRGQSAYAPDVDALSHVDLKFEREGDAARAQVGGGVFDLRGADAGLAGLHIARVSAGEAPLYAALTESPDLASQLSDWPRPDYVLPPGLQVAPLVIASDASIAGELVMAGANDSSVERAEPRPAVLFVSGAGPQDRRGMVLGPDGAPSIDLGSHEFQDALAAAGFVVLRYDDRGVGESELGPEPAFGFQATVNDARAALRALIKHPTVDPTRTFIVGHGEGALVAAIVAQSTLPGRATIRGVGLLAAPGRNLRELVYDQVRHALSTDGRSEVEIRMAVDEARRVHEAALADADLPASSEVLRRWMQEVFAIDPVAEIRKLKRRRVPVLALHGGKDFQVNPVADFELVALAVREGAEGGMAERIEGVDYMFKPEPGRSHAGHYRDLTRRVDPAVIARLVTWLRARADG